MPLIAVFGMGLILLVTAVLLIGMQNSLQTWLRPLLDRLSHPSGNFFVRVALKTAFLALAAVQSIIGYLAHVLSHAIAAKAAAIGQYFHGLARMVDDAVVNAEGFALDTYRALTHLRNVSIPTLIEVAVKPVRVTANTAFAIARTLDSELTATRIDLQQMLRGLPWKAPATVVGAFGAFYGAFAHLWDYVYGQVTTRLNSLYNVRVPRLEREVTRVLDDLYTTGRNSLAGIRTRLATIEGVIGQDFALTWRKLKELLTAAGAQAWLLGTLAALLGLTVAAVETGIRALFCRNTQNVARKLCAMDETLLAGLLAGTLTFALVLDPKLVVKAGEEVEAAIGTALRDMASL